MSQTNRLLKPEKKVRRMDLDLEIRMINQMMNRSRIEVSKSKRTPNVTARPRTVQRDGLKVRRRLNNVRKVGDNRKVSRLLEDVIESRKCLDVSQIN